MISNNNRTHGFGLYWAALISLLLGGCYSSTLHEKPQFNQASFRANPPRTLAILPTIENGGNTEIAALMRTALIEAIAPLAFKDKEVSEVDKFLASMAATHSVAPDKLPTEITTNPKLADCVIYSRITNISRLYLVLYAHYRFDMDLWMMDTRTGEEIYRNHFVFYDRLGTPVFVMPGLGLAGVAGGSVGSLLHLRRSRLEETFEEGAEQIALKLPVPPDLAATNEGGIRLTDMKVTRPFATLGPGERVIVKAQATPGCRASFDVGKLARGIPMAENTPGSYMGIYEVKPGDNADYVLVELHLERGADRLDHAIKTESFAVDTTPPPRAHVVSASSPWMRSGVLLNLELESATALPDKDKPLEYQIFRKNPATNKYERVGVSTKPHFLDSGAHAGQTEEYYIITKDSAGNLSPAGQVKRIKIG